MKAGMSFEFSRQNIDHFNARCDIAIRNVFRGTKKATEEACIEIMANSATQVPKLTYTLLASAYWEVTRRSDTSANTWAYEAVLGYGGNGDPINPITGQPASSYMVAVHEDLNARHSTGKAKFLEDPVREYAEAKFARTVLVHAQESLSGMSGK